MENKINIAELLKDCPKGMELDCTMYDKVTLSRVDDNEDSNFPIELLRSDGCKIILTEYGQYEYMDDAKCVIFPKGKTTWDGFTPPCKFKDADIVASTIHPAGTWVGIFKQYINNEFESYCFISANGVFNNIGLKNHVLAGSRLATEEEKTKLFQAIKDNKYKWNAETKTLEKLIETEFKVGDRIRHKTNTWRENVVTEIKDTHYILDDESALPFIFQDQYELVPNKFDINTLKPFDKVLIRDKDTQKWCASLFSHCNGLEFYKYKCISGCGYAQCIPYKNNEYLLGTIEDCDNFYKNW